MKINTKGLKILLSILEQIDENFHINLYNVHEVTLHKRSFGRKHG
jgi:hypothetical protein